MTVWPTESLATARAALSEADFAATWAEGQAMTLEPAVAFALDEIADVSGQ